MEVSVKVGIGSRSQMARDRFMAVFQATPGKMHPHGMLSSSKVKPGAKEGTFQGKPML